MSDIIVTENEPRPHRPDNTAERATAEQVAEQIVHDLDAGLVSRRSAVKVRDAADRTIRGDDLGRGLDRAFGG